VGVLDVLLFFPGLAAAGFLCFRLCHDKKFW
jgi:hypothetical protein